MSMAASSHLKAFIRRDIPSELSWSRTKQKQKKLCAKAENLLTAKHQPTEATSVASLYQLNMLVVLITTREDRIAADLKRKNAIPPQARTVAA